MTDRVGSDNPSVATARGALVRRGGTRRPAVEVPLATSGEDAVTAPDGPVRLSIDGQWYHAPVDHREGSWKLLGAFDNARLARERAGTDRLAEWVEEQDLSFGRSVLVDEVDPGAAYGLRVPGEEATYEDWRGPSEGLRRIAEDLES